MPAIVIKSKNPLSDSVPRLEYTIYKQRVEADGGYIENEEKTKAAFAFLTENNISINNVFVGASPEFGVKYTSSGTLEKLYSIGKKEGDLLTNISVPNLFSVGEVNGNKALQFKGASSNYLYSQSGLKSIDSLTMCCINKPPILGSGSEYGNTLNFGLMAIYNRDTLKAISGNLPPTRFITEGGALLQTLAYKRNSKDEMPWLWNGRFVFDSKVKDFLHNINLSGGVFSRAYRVSKKPPSEIYTAAGEVILVTNDAPKNTIQSDYSVLAGCTAVGSGLYSDVFEFWVLVDTDSESSAKITHRVNYISV